MPLTQNAPTSGLPGVYVQEIAPPPAVPPTPGDIVGLVLEGSRGLLGVPTWVKDLAAFNSTFGGRTPTAADATKLLSGYPSYLALFNNGVQDILGVRVASSLAKTAHIDISNGTGVMVRLYASSPGTWANGNLVVTITAGAITNTFDLVVVNNATGETDVVRGLSASDNAGTINAINAACSLVYATQPALLGPTAAPTFSATTGSGTVGAGSYYAVVTYYNAKGESQGSPETAQVTLASSGKLTLTVPSLTGATGWKAYITAAGGPSGSETYAATSTTFGSAVDITAAWAASTLTPPAGPIDSTGHLIAAVTGAGDTSAAATPGSFTFPTTTSGSSVAGVNGEGAVAAQYLGNNGTPVSGVYAFAGLDLDEKPAYVVLAENGGSDVTAGTTPATWSSLAQFGYDNNCQVVVAYAPGTSSSSAVTAWGTFTGALSAANAQHIKCSWPAAVIYDSTYARNYTVSSAPYLAAMGGVTDPDTSAANKVVAGIVDLEYTLASDSAATTLTGARINPLSGRIPQKGIGYLSDYMADGTKAFAVRMKSYLEIGLTEAWAAFSDIPNSAPNRRLVQNTGMDFLDSVASDGYLEPNPAGATTTPVAPPPTTTTGKKTASSAAGVQPSTATTTGTAAQAAVYLLKCDSDNNLDQNGVPLSSSFIVDGQIRLTDNADNIYLRLQASTTTAVTLTVQQ